MSNETSKTLIATLLVLIGGIGGGMLYTQHQEKERQIDRIIRSETVQALEQAWTQTLEYRNAELSNWDERLNEGLEKRFLPWHYSIFTREILEARAFACMVQKVLLNNCEPRKELENQVLGAFQEKVLDDAGRPSDETRKLVGKYTESIVAQINEIPRKHPEVTPERLQRFLKQAAVQLPVGEGKRAVSNSLATLVQNDFNDDVLAQKMVENLVKDGLEGVATQVTTQLAMKAFGTSAKYVLGPLVKAGFLAWEYYDLKQEESKQKEGLRVKISSSFAGMEASVAEDAEKIMQTLETGILQALPQGQALQVAHTGPALMLAAHQPVNSPDAVENMEAAPTPVETPVETPARASEMPYALQVASRESYTEAQQLAKQLPDSDVIMKDVGGKTWYAVLSGGFETKEAALAHKQRLLADYPNVGGEKDLREAFVRTRPDQEGASDAQI
ncbi:MAG: SPOR domain-containing protein [Candidatus Sericytochromatia bacterium]